MSVPRPEMPVKPGVSEGVLKPIRWLFGILGAAALGALAIRFTMAIEAPADSKDLVIGGFALLCFGVVYYLTPPKIDLNLNRH